MTGYQWVSLTTDYGLADGFVASCHGVLARQAPGVRIIDVTHLVPPGDVAHGAYQLAQTVAHLPAVCIHVAVVDPGVGTARRAIAIRAGDAILIGPDNGLLLPAAQALGGPDSAVRLGNTAWFAHPVSATFHGRDVFVPVAARLANGADLADAGPALDPAALVRLPPPVVSVDDEAVEASVLTVDRFGNIQLAAPGTSLARFGPSVGVAGRRAARGTTFADAPAGELVVYSDSAGLVAIAVNGGDAATLLSVRAGDVIRVSDVTRAGDIIRVSADPG